MTQDDFHIEEQKESITCSGYALFSLRSWRLRKKHLTFFNISTSNIDTSAYTHID